MRSIAARLSESFALVRAVPVRDCVHFCAYRYGRQEPNPYERYAIALAAGRPVHEIRAEFTDGVTRYRPRDLGQALGVVLSREYPLWWLPWRTPSQVTRHPGWVASAAAVVDLMTHFAEQGVPRSLLAKEFHWHETAFSAMSANGYQPERHTYITARELRAEGSAYLLTDGNHRLSALSALGVDTVTVRLPKGTAVLRAQASNWPLVRAGMMERRDALEIFDAYHRGNRIPAMSAPAPVID